MRLALLSTARINTLLAAGARQAADVEVVAVGSRDRARAEAQAAALGIARVHSSYEAVLEDPDVDAVYIALPNSLHVPWTIRALQAGKHVLCEKPLSRRPADVERAFEEAARAGRVLAEAFMWRHHPQARRLRELLPEVGELRLVRAAFSFPLQRTGDIRTASALDGGALMDVGCYCVSAARLLAGEPLAVAAEQVTGGDGVDLRLVGTMRFPGEVLAHFDCGLDLAVRDDLEVVGRDGVLFLDDPWHSRAPAIELRRGDGAVERIEIERADPYACELEDFAAAVRGERAAPFGRADAVAQARAIAALYESGATGRTVLL
jgi:D-xylose 1-dehydrogenase (NADP+, D-xylono-1,5-lactone-forming)